MILVLLRYNLHGGIEQNYLVTLMNLLRSFNETEVLKELYVAGYTDDIYTVILDENEYFRELSIILLKCYLYLKCLIRMSG